MANTLGFGPMGILPDTATPQSPADKRKLFDTLSIRSKVPANVLMALTEDGKTDPGLAASKISEAMASGKKVEDIVGPEVMSRAYDIADQVYADRKPAPPPKPEGGFLNAAGVGIDQMQQGIGSAVEGLGRSIGLQSVEAYGADVAARNKAEAAAGSQGMTSLDDVNGIGSAAQFASETVGQNAPQLGLSLAGAGGGTLAGAAIGSVVPVVGTTVGGIVGGVLGGLGVSIPLFYGQNRERQKEAIGTDQTRSVDESTAFLASLPQAALDTLSSKLLLGAGKLVTPLARAGGGLLTRAVRGTAKGVITEVPTEIGQQVIERAQAGLDITSDEAMKEYIAAGVAAGILGGGVGSASEVYHGQNGGPQPAPQPSPKPLALPAPNNGGTIIPEAPPRDPNTPDDGSGGGQGVMSGGAISTPPSPSVTPATPPMGPISRAAVLAPDLTPQPEAPAPTPLFPDQKPGNAVQLLDPETGVTHDATFLGETPEGVSVRVNGEAIMLTAQEFDQASRAAAQVKPDGKPKATSAAPPSQPATSAQVPSNPLPTPSNPAPDKPLTAQVAQSAAKATKRPKEPAAPLTPPEALKRAQMIEDTAKRGGWNARLKKQHAEFMAVANQGVENGALPDVGGNVAANSGTNERGNAAAGQADSKDVPTGPADTSVAPQQPAPSAAKDVAAPTGIAKQDGPLNAPKIVTKAERGNPVQPDMLGGTDTPEAEMMKKERRRREWGQYLAIAEGTKSPWDGELEGRTVTARPGKVTIRARTDGPSDLDYRIDTSGMSSDEIARATRGALSELDRRAPLQKVEKKDQPVTAKPADQNTIKETPQTNQKPELQAPKNAPVLEEKPVNGQNKTGYDKALATSQWIGLKAAITQFVGRRTAEFRTVALGGLDFVVSGKGVAAYRGGNRIEEASVEGKTPDDVIAALRLRLGNRMAPEDEVGAANVAAPEANPSPTSTPAQAPEPQKSRPGIGSPEYTLTDARNDLIEMQTQEAASATASDARLLSRIERQKQLVKEMEGEGAKLEAPKPVATGLLSSLSQEKQDRAAELKAMLAAKARTQLSSGLDPEYITLGSELVALYIEAGTKRFAQMLRDFAESTGLTLRQAQEPMRAAYNHVRDNMDLAGEDVSDMDDAKAVLAEVRNALAEADAAVKGNSPNTSQSAPKSDTVAVNRTDGADDGSADSTDTGKMGQGREPQADSSGRGDGNAAGPTASRSMAGPEAGAGASNEGMGRAKPTRSRSGGSDSAGDNPASEGRLPSGGSTTASMDGLGDARPDGKRPEGAGRSNYRITDPEALFAGGPKARFSKNRKAMEAYQRVTDESRQPTPEELDELAAFTGWGSFGQELFQGSWDYNRAKPEWKAEDAWLREHLGKDAWESAQNSIINAHYTDPPTVKAIWDAVKAMGFKGGRVLEPAMGVGNFFGMMPSDIEANSSLTGIELEQTTGAIAKMLYPRANVRIMGYEKSQVADGFYDLVIGNWPFANVTMADRRYDKLSPSLHDYFFVKGLDQVRAGGLVVGITSAFSMDGQKNLGVRRHLARNAELVASFRLPSGAFEKYAGTKVVTDLIILRKRPEPAFDVSDEAWIKSVPFVTPSGDTINLNQYYIDNPQQILGTIDSGHGTTYGKAGMIVHRPADIAERLAGIASLVPADGFRPVVRGKETRFVANTTTDRRFSITIGKDGALYHVLGDQMSPLEDAAKIKTTSAVETEKRLASIKALVGLRSAAEATLNADQAGSADADALRADLKKRYQSFVKDHGKIADSFALRTMEKLRDPNSGLVAALETRTGDPSPLMSEPTVRKNRKLDNPTIRDAFVMARNEAVQLDLARVSEISSKPVDDVTKELLDAKAIYRAPGGAFEPSDAYLSGNVRQKLREAEDALAQGEDMQASVDALKAVIPADVPYFQIEARFGADWLPVEHNRQFILDTLGITNATDSDMRLTRAVTGWRLEVSDKLARMPGIPDITGAPLPGQRGTGLSLRRFLEATLNTQTITVTYEDDEGTHKDTKATEQANQKAADLRQKFGEWVWGDPERRMEVERDYNEAMNAVATPVVDGSFLEFPGMALKRGDQPFNLRQHQSNAIWKGILNQRGIYGHEVGTGKTITMTGIAVESRRYGLARKPLLIAHNANSAAVAAEAQETYPGAKILYVNNLAPDEINAQLARMATEDWDLIVIPHSLLDRMALTYDTLMSMAADDIAAYEREAIQAAEDDPSGGGLTIEDMDDPDKLKKMRLGVTAKEMVKARNRMIQNIEKQSQRASKDGAVSFEKLGIDMILVDESHEFKKPPLATRMQVKGLNTGTSNKSLALRFLTSYVKAQRGGTGVHVFTGTPITNTLSEIYHQMFYAMDDVMRQNSVDTWDGFFKTFADTIADVELTSTGDFENVERLAAFINVSELRRMAGQYMDIVFAKDMPEFKPRATESGKIITDQNLSAKERDYLENGRMDRPEGRPYKQVINDIGPMGTDQKRILDEVIYYANVFKSAGGKQRREIMLGGGPDAPIVYNNVPNRASMDARLQEIDAEDHPKSKANRAVNNLARIYLEEPMATQVLFMDEGYSDETTSTKTSEDGTKTVKKKKKFNLAKDIVEKLVAKGVKREEIAIVAGGVTAEQKKAIADAMNQLKVRVVIGQTKTLGVGVNMQKYLRAMHHLDAPWMPGDLEQRNGRGERQGNTWNTVFEYRYLTEGLDGRRWQVLSIKDRFIKAFLQAKDGVRVIESDAADDAETVDGSALADTLSQAAGDPRLMLISKLKKNIDRLQNRERIHTTGIADALKKLRQIKEQIERIKEELPPLRDDAEHVVALRAAGTFTATMNGKTFTERAEATEAINAYLVMEGTQLARGKDKVLPLEIQGFAVKISKTSYAYKSDDFSLELMRRATRNPLQKTLASIEATIRGIPTVVEKQDERINDLNGQVSRLDKAKDEPFQQAGDLAKKKAQKAAIEQDLQDNPVPPPSWLRIGAPIETLAFIDGKEHVVTGHRWTSEAWLVSTDAGDFDYKGVTDQNGMPLYEPREFVAPVINEGSKMKGVEDEESESRFDLPPVATLTGKELGDWEDMRQLGKKAEAWYRANLLGKRVTNAQSGMEISFTSAAAKKLSGRKGDVLYRSVPALREILEKGTLTKTSPETKGRSHIKAWHAISATVMMDGMPRDLVAHVMETKDGNLHYDLSRDMSDGARFLREGADTSITAGRYGLEDNPVELNLDFAEQEIKPEVVPVTGLKALALAVEAEVVKHGLAGKVTPRVVRGLLGASGVPIQGRQIGNIIEVNPAAADGMVGVMRHEIVHALRDPALWDAPFGLFSRAEWLGLVNEAKADAALVAKIAEKYGDKSQAVRTEEAVAETYRLWAQGRDMAGPVAKAFAKVKAYLQAAANALRGQGFQSAALTMERIASGSIGGRGPDGGGRAKKPRLGSAAPNPAESRFDPSSVKAKAMGVIGSRHWRNPGEFVSNLVTDAMAGRGDYSALALVPGRPLFAELGKHLMAAKAYLRGKEEMDALRNQWHAKSDEVAQKWMALRDKMPDANNDMMDLMHRTTLAGIDPSKPDTWKHAMEAGAKAEIGRHGPDAAEWAFKVMEQIKAHTDSYAKLRAEFVALPSEFQALYPEVRAQYDKLGDDFEKAILENIQNATRIGLKRAERAHRKEMERIRDEGLEGAEKDTAIEAADAKLTAAKKRGGFGAKARIQTLRKLFESNKLKGPYFPLARFGTYFVTIRDENGAVTSFSRFAKESQQQAFMREMKDAGEARIEFGTIDQSAKLRSQVNPAFVADMEALMSEAGAPNEVLDMIWQRYLETLPDQSIRTSKIHRKGRAGYNNDALRAFGSHMFHGAHQLARLKYGLVLEEHLNDAEEEARRADNPNRALLVVAEMKKRHDFAMNPTGSSVVASMSSLAFVWYLAATPAAALANISQTTVVGAPILSARFQKAGLTGVLAALGKATKDFAAGKGAKITDTWTVENSPNLSAEERAAMVEAYRRGIVDRTQAHDLASVAETGIEYNPWREKWMKRISFFFHHAERFNREVTFLAAYRLAITEGQKSEDAMNIAADMTYKTHFDMQNTSRPRVMQNDLGKILTTFRNFTVNMLWRLFRDSHQAMNGATKEERREARAQLVGITLSLMAHAGIRGTWGYGLIMLLLGILTPGADDDDIEEWLQDALLMEGDNPGVAMWNYTMGAALNGVPGQVMGVSLTDRIGMPNLWFRGQDRDLEGADLYSAYVGDLLGPTYSVGQGFFRGAQLAADGQWWRGTEAAVPKVIRDAMKSVRYVSEGALTMNGDSLVENVNPYQALMQGIGFTPAKIAERYDINNRLKNHEKRIIDERSALQKAAVKEAMSGSGISESMLGKIQDFNSRFPEYPITSDTLRQSAQSTALAHQRNEFGVSLNPKLNERLRSERATAIYN